MIGNDSPTSSVGSLKISFGNSIDVLNVVVPIDTIEIVGW